MYYLKRDDGMYIESSILPKKNLDRYEQITREEYIAAMLELEEAENGSIEI